MTTAIHRATIRAFDAATYTATVQTTGSLATYLAGVPVAHHLRPNLLTAGTKCGVVFFDEANPTDAAVVLLFGGAPATDAFDVDGDLNVDGLITVGGTVDGVDVSAHAHSGAGQGGTVGHGSLSGVTADQHHAQAHSHSQSLWLTAAGGNGTAGSQYGSGGGSYVGYLMVDGLNRNVSATGRIPTGLGTLTKAVVVLLPKGTGNIRISAYVNFAASGEAYQTHNLSIVNAIVAATADQMLEWDISSALTGLAAGDILGVNVNRTADNADDTCEADVLFPGVHLEYT